MASSDADRRDEEESHGTPTNEEEDTGAQIAPIIKKAKLYRFDKEGNQWKEQGMGSVRLLKYKETEKVLAGYEAGQDPHDLRKSLW
ncbi:uncharacterized protein A4U43_C05F9330 [Asparagus officinalis]|uniref:RanBD1 domain-containing protein n=1 Tax=Asparagus officinalis TaxID=4686 RepID=A0A5P1ER16_ASPOF|nr:uncharacterized protein A4U43_C05F9330 [Asparagus officinalis]